MKYILCLTLGLISFSSTAFASKFPTILGQRYDIGGYQMHIYCQGSGSPTVIIDTGLGSDSWDWRSIVDSAAHKTKTCVYDRPGYGWSDIGPKPRNSRRIAHELNLLLEQAHIEPPYVLVGHSFGGFNMRVFAENHPEDLAGLVLIDASHESQYQQLDIKLPPPHKGQRNIFISIPLEHMDASDQKDYTLRDRAFRSASYEIAALSQSAEQVSYTDAIPTVPLIVISRGQAEWQGNEQAHKKEKIWIALQQDLARLSPISQHIFANHSGHNIPKQQPDIIVDAIGDVVELAWRINSP